MLRTCQQVVSKWEKGENKRMPPWTRYIPIALGDDTPASNAVQLPTFEELAEERGFALIEEIDLAFGMGATFLDSDRAPEVKGLVPFRASWLRDMFRGPVESLKVVRGSGDSMQPTIQDGDFVLIDTSRRRIDEQDVIWAVSYGDLGMIRRLRQLPSGNVLMMPDNSVVRATEASDGELWVMGRVIWIGRRM
jgi:phage repressor protein C with HTH and peptisase S24 domain